MIYTRFIPKADFIDKHSWLIIIMITILASCASPHYTYQAQQARRDIKNPGTTITIPKSNKTQTSTSTESSKTNTSYSKTGKAAPILKKAASYIGTKYKYGGTSKSGIDCSGLMCVSFKAGGVTLPRVSTDQAKQGTAVSINNLKQGDLLFFTYPGGSKITHVGVVEEVKGPSEVIFIHASSSRGVMRNNLFDSYYKKTFVKARRVL